MTSESKTEPVSPIPKWVRELTEQNFLAVYDVVLDIKEALQLSDDVVVPLLQSVVKFKILMPGDGINMRDRYCELRWNATALLKKRGVIQDFKFLKEYHRWEGRLRIGVDRERFQQFAGSMDDEFTRRKRPKRTEETQKVTFGGAERDPLGEVHRLLYRFHAVAVQLRQRHEGRSTLDINDEYDVQDLLHALLLIQFDDVRPEEWTPSYAGKASRVDFLLKPEQIVVEVKKTRARLGEKELGDQLIVDTARYSKIADCRTLVCMIYDPEDRIPNPGGLQADLSGEKEGIKVEVLVVPKRY